jgi:hypothetical protein
MQHKKRAIVAWRQDTRGMISNEEALADDFRLRRQA